MLLLWFWSTATDVAMALTSIETFYCQDIFAKLILYGTILVLTINQVLCPVCHALSEFCLINTSTGFPFGLQVLDYNSY